jgi:hypothetical protein
LRPFACAVGGLGWLAACAPLGCNSDLARLERAEDAANATSASAGGSGGQAEVATITATIGSSSATGIVEPPGATKLTFVNGIVDEDSMRFCLVKYPDGPASEHPWPSAAGLAFAAAGTIDINSVVPNGSDVEVRAVVGSASDVGSHDCAELTTARGVSMLSLGVVPASAFEAGKSLLLVSYGCVGGPTHKDGMQALACGPGYTPTTPTAALALGFMSRLGSEQAVRMQFVDAIAAMTQPAQVAVVPGFDNLAGQQVVAHWTLGAILPFPPFDELSLDELGALPKAKLEVRPFGNPTTVTFAQAFNGSELSLGAVKNGDSLVFVAVGAQPGVPVTPLWHPATFTVVAADP